MGFLDIFKFGRKEEKVATLPIGAASRMRPVYGASADCFKNSAFWSCVTLISSKLATLPLTPHEEKRNGGSTTMDRTRALYNLLQSPNPYMSHHDFFTIMALNYLLPGQAIAILERAKNGIVINMYPVSPSCVHSQWVDGVQLFTITGLNGAKTYRREDLLIIRGVPISYDDVLSPLECAREGLELSEKAKNLQYEYYEGGSVLGKFIKVPQSTYNNLREEIKEVFDNSRKYRNIVLPDNITVDPIKADGESISKLIEAQNWDVAEVSRRFHVPKCYLGDTSGGYGTAEQQAIQLVQECLQPICKTWEMAFKMDVCQDYEYVKFDLQSLMRGDHATRQAWYTAMLTHGVYSVNEVRALEDLEPIGPEGDVHYFQSGFANLKDIESGAFTKDGGSDTSDNAEETYKTHLSILEGLIREGKSIEPVAKMLGVPDSTWISGYDKALKERIAKGSALKSETYRALNALLVKHASDKRLKITVDGIEPVDGYFTVGGKKFRNPPFYEGDTRIVKEWI